MQHNTKIFSFPVAVALLLGFTSCSSGGDGAPGEPPEVPEVSLPSQHIDLSLIGVHDPQSDDYNGDCIGCHGTLLDEVATDGVTPMVHSTMVQLHGAGNDRCIGCHSDGVDFIAFSQGQVRGQVHVEHAVCTNCHDGTIEGFPQFYVR